MDVRAIEHSHPRVTAADSGAGERQRSGES
jgi:hypothetical protein